MREKKKHFDEKMVAECPHKCGSLLVLVGDNDSTYVRTSEPQHCLTLVLLVQGQKHKTNHIANMYDALNDNP